MFCSDVEKTVDLMFRVGMSNRCVGMNILDRSAEERSLISLKVFFWWLGFMMTDDWTPKL